MTARLRFEVKYTRDIRWRQAASGRQAAIPSRKPRRPIGPIRLQVLDIEEHRDKEPLT